MVWRGPSRGCRAMSTKLRNFWRTKWVAFPAGVKDRLEGLAPGEDVQGGPGPWTGSRHRVPQARGTGWLWDGGAVTVPGWAVSQR